MNLVEWAECVARTELGLEFFFSTFCFISNVYFSLRFTKISTLDEDLKTIFVILHILKAILAVIHPITESIPPEWYSIEEEHYIGAIIFYFLHFFHSICFYLVCIEYALIVFERKMAVHSFYSKKKQWKGRPVLYFSIATITFGVIIKCIIVFHLNKNHRPWKELLDKVFTIDKYVPSNILAFVICYTSAVYGLIEFLKLRRYIREHWYAGRSLAEAIQIKRTGLISKLLMPITLFYCILATMGGTGYFFSLYLHFYWGFSLYSPIMLAFVYMQSTGVSMYNLLSTVYLIWLLKPMRKMMYQDLSRLLGIRLKVKHRIKDHEINWSEEREHHFTYLKKAWN